MQQPSFPPTGFVRLPTIIALILVSRSGWWQRVKAGKFPAPVKPGTRCTALFIEDIRRYIESAGGNV